MSEGSGVVRRSDGVITRQLAGETVLVPIRQDRANFQKVHVLNETGAAVWEALAQPRAFDELVDDLAARFEADREVIAADVRELLDDLQERGLVEWSADE